ncbi:MAG: hypothetical protein U0746_16835 [Gemmataceae bacterium]
MTRLILTLGLAASVFGLVAPARAQFIPPVVDRSAQTQVVRWFNAYLGRNPNAQELAVLTNQYLMSGNPLYVQSILLASNEFVIRNGASWPQAYINAIFRVTLGRNATVVEIAQLQPLLLQNGRLWFAQAFLTQLATTAGWGGYNINRFNTIAVPVPVVVPIIVR